MNELYIDAQGKDKEKWSILSIVRARILSGIVETSTMSALTNATV